MLHARKRQRVLLEQKKHAEAGGGNLVAARALASSGRAPDCRPDARAPCPAVRPVLANAASWDELNQAVGGNLIRLQSPLADCAVAADNSSCQDVLQNLKNPYYIGDQPGLTQTSGWVDAWVSTPSAYAVAARTGRYVQGGGCATVGVAGLIQSGGFGSFSKNYGMAAAGLLEAEIVTPDGAVRIANACTNPELFWGIKGGGGGSLGVVTTLTLRPMSSRPGSAPRS